MGMKRPPALKPHVPHPHVGSLAIHPQSHYTKGVQVGPRGDRGKFVPHIPKVRKGP